MLLSKVNKEIVYTKPSPHLVSSVAVEISNLNGKYRDHLHHNFISVSLESIPGLLKCLPIRAQEF
jgi:hypothetical protein